MVWTYGALGLIVAFCAGLGVYFYIARRKRVRDSRENYEFEVLRDEEDAPLAGGGAKGGRGGKRRAGELYDAFAEGSSEGELDLSDEEDEDDRRRDAVYRDQVGESSEGIAGTAAGGGAGGQQFGAAQKRQLDTGATGERVDAHVLGGDSDEESDDDRRTTRR